MHFFSCWLVLLCYFVPSTSAFHSIISNNLGRIRWSLSHNLWSHVLLSLNLWWRVIADTDWVCCRCGSVEITVSCEDGTQHTQQTLRKAPPVDQSSSSNSQLAPDVFVDITTKHYESRKQIPIIRRQSSISNEASRSVLILQAACVRSILHWMNSFVNNITVRVIDVYTAACWSAVDRLATGDTGDIKSETTG